MDRKRDHRINDIMAQLAQFSSRIDNLENYSNGMIDGLLEEARHANMAEMLGVVSKRLEQIEQICLSVDWLKLENVRERIFQAM